jgi:hypothetical protein
MKIQSRMTRYKKLRGKEALNGQEAQDNENFARSRSGSHLKVQGGEMGRLGSPRFLILRNFLTRTWYVQGDRLRKCCGTKISWVVAGVVVGVVCGLEQTLWQRRDCRLRSGGRSRQGRMRRVGREKERWGRMQ